MAASLKRFLASPLPIIGMFLLLIVSLTIMAEATQSSGHFHRWQWWVASFNGVLALGLLAMIGNSLIQLAKRLKNREAGSRLSLRMTAMVSGFTLLPTSMVFGFSIWLISTGVDSWFDVGVDNALNKAMELSRSSVDLQMRQLRTQVERLMQEPIDTSDPEAAAIRIHDLADYTGAIEASLLDSSNMILAAQGASDILSRLPGDGAGDTTVDDNLVGVPKMFPDLPTEAQLQLLQDSGVYMAQEDHPEHGPVIRILLQVSASNQDLPLIQQTIFPISDHMLSLAGSVEEAAAIYQRLLESRTPLKYNLTFVLSLALLLGLLFAIWASLYSAQRILAPIPELARGIEAVADGDYTQRLPAGRNDELAQLTHSFNDMISQLASTRYVAETRRHTIEKQRAYLHTVLDHQSSGVISINEHGRLQTANRAADTILETEFKSFFGQPILALREAYPKLESLWNLIEHQLREPTELEQQLQLRYGYQVLHCQGAQLPNNTGCVIVFSDTTDLQQAQRQAAWGEVARRLAHEIKNPLTPIRLSAERVQHRLQAQLDEDDSNMLKRATQTIVRQVDSIKTMINDFGDYAASRFTLEPTALNALVEEVRELYLGHHSSISILMDLSDEEIWIQADPVRFRQLLHNLIKNALEAQAEQEEGSLTLSTRADKDSCTLTVQDAGPGFSTQIIGRVFEPYVTTKPHGNGLGLAVVQRVVEDHRGHIRVYNEPTGGGCVSIQFAITTPPSSDSPNRQIGA